MTKRPVTTIIFILLALSVLIFSVLIYRSIQEDKIMELVDRRLANLYRNDEKTIPVSHLSTEQLSAIRSEVLSVSDESFREERLLELGELEKLVFLRKRLIEVEDEPIQNFSMSIYRELLLKINDIESISSSERNQLYALRDDYDNHQQSQKKLDEFNLMMSDLLDVDPTDPESLEGLIRAIQEAGAQDLLEEHMGDLWESFELAEQLEEWLKNNTDMQDLDVESFVNLIDLMQERGMAVEDYLLLARVMNLLQKVQTQGVLALSPEEFLELVGFMQRLDPDEAQTIMRPLLRGLEGEIRRVLGNLL